MHHLDFNEILSEKARTELRKNAAWYFEQILKAAPYKTGVKHYHQITIFCFCPPCTYCLFIEQYVHFSIGISLCILINATGSKVKKSKVGDPSRGWPEGSLFDSLLHQGVGEGATPFPGLIHFTLDPYLIMLSVKQGGIKYHFLSLWYPRSPGPLANTLTARPMEVYNIY